MHLFTLGGPSAAPTVGYIFGTTKHIKTHTIHSYLVMKHYIYQFTLHQTQTLHLHFTLIDFQFYFTHFACTVSSPFLGHFATITCCVSPLRDVQSGVNVEGWINEAFWEKEQISKGFVPPTAPRMVQQSDALSIAPFLPLWLNTEYIDVTFYWFVWKSNMQYPAQWENY